MVDHWNALKNYISKWQRAVVAFSGGVDSSLVLKAAIDALGRNSVLSVTVTSPLHTAEELAGAIELAAQLGVSHRMVPIDELAIEAIAANPPDRCYHCKRHRFERLVRLAEEMGFDTVLEGSNASDADDYRPGLKAVQSFAQVHSPLLELGIDKASVRALAWQQGLSNWDLAARACLASRIPYGDRLILTELQAVGAAERLLGELGFVNPRVRRHGDIARLELAPNDLGRLLDPGFRAALSAQIKACGFRYVAADLDGYRTGSLNETLPL